nr:MAG TPA: Integrase [Caudoviricetes sp.]
MPKRRNKGEGTVYYSEKLKLWTGQVTIGYDSLSGKQKRKSIYGKTKSELIEKKKEFEKYNSGLQPSSTLDEVLYKYLYCIKKPTLKERSWEKYESLYINHISKAPFLYKRIDEIKYTDIQIWYNEPTLPKGSLKIINMLIKGAFNTAKMDNIIFTNITENLKVPKHIKIDKYNVFSKDEQKIFIDYLNSCTIEQEPLKYLFLFALATGLRRGEILALEKKDIKDTYVDINKNVQVIKKDGKYIAELTTLKTDSSIGQVPLPQKIIDILPEILDTKYNIVFSNENGEYMNKNRPLKRLKSICKQLGIKQISFHGLRHSYATRLFEAGVQIKTVQKLMRHKDIQTTINVYTHVMPNVIDDAIEKLNESI